MNEIENVHVWSEGNAITFEVTEGPPRTIVFPFSVTSSWNPVVHVSMALAAALLHAYDRIENLERQLLED